MSLLRSAPGAARDRTATRRAVLQGGLLAAATTAPVLGSAGGPRGAAAAPVATTVHLHMGNLTWPPGPALGELIDQALAPLLARNPGLQVRFFPQVVR